MRPPNPARNAAPSAERAGFGRVTTDQENPLVISRCPATARWASAYSALCRAVEAAEVAGATDETLLKLDASKAAVLAEYEAARSLRLDPPPHVHSVDHEGTWWRAPE